MGGGIAGEPVSGGILTASVALCTYNGGSYITEQVLSILDQVRKPLEIILSDDGSRDNTIELAFKALRSRPLVDVPLKVIDGSHAGVTGNFARAMGAASGDLVVLCDQDDIWHTDRLQTAIPSFERRPELLLQHSDARIVDESGLPCGAGLFRALSVTAEERKAINDGHAFDVYIRRNLATGATVIVRQSLLSAALPFPGEWIHDEWLALIAASVGEVEILENELIDYRQHDLNVIGVEEPTLLRRARKLFVSRGDRYERLAARSRILHARLIALGSVNPEIVQSAAGKARFEAERARYPRSRAMRIAPVFREFLAGSYGTYSSQRSLDVLRDVVQPA